MTIELQPGRVYRTRDGSRAEVFKTGVQISGRLGNYLEVVGLYFFNNGKVKQVTWYTDGKYSTSGDHDFDLLEEWVDPVYRYRPVFLNNPFSDQFQDMDDAIEAAGKHATAENPLMGYLRTDIAGFDIKIIKPGQQDNE